MVVLSGRNRRTHVKLLLCVCFRLFGKRDRRVFDNVELTDQELKSLFMGNLLELVNGGLKDVSMSLVDFVDWLGCKGRDCFLFPIILFFSFGTPRIRVACYSFGAF